MLATNFERNTVQPVLNNLHLITIHNMNKLVSSSCALAFILIAAVSSAQAQGFSLKVGTVDMDRIFKSYYKTKDAENSINEARSTAKKELDERMETYKANLDQINKLNDELQEDRVEQGKAGCKVQRA